VWTSRWNDLRTRISKGGVQNTSSGLRMKAAAAQVPDLFNHAIAEFPFFNVDRGWRRIGS
jgi:hypothetical protein